MQKNKLLGFDKIKDMILHNGDGEIFVEPRTRENFEKEMVQDFDSENGQTDPNMILAKDVYMSMDRMKTHRNPSVFVIGGTEEERMNCIVKPNVMQENASFVISDPTGELFHTLALPLLNNGYKLKIFSTLRVLNTYNPFDYLYNEEGETDRKKINIFVETLARGVEENASINDPFWDETVKRWLLFTTSLLLEWYPKAERNLYNLLNLTKKGMNATNEIKRLIDDLDTKHKEKLEISKTWYYYNLFNNVPEKTRLAAIISIYTSLLLPFESLDQVKALTTTRYIHDKDNNLVLDENNNPIPDDNNLNIEKLGSQKTVLFINAESTDKSYNFLITLLYNHVFTATMRESFFYKDQYVIRDAFSEMVESGFKTKEAAEHRLELLKNATVISRDNKTAHGTMAEYYIYNKEAEDAETPKDLYYTDANHNKGILMSVYNKEIGKKIIERCQNAKVCTEGYRLPVPLRVFLNEYSGIYVLPDMENILFACAPYRISYTITLPSIAYLAEKNKNIKDAIMGMTDNFVFFGTPNEEMEKYKRAMGSELDLEIRERDPKVRENGEEKPASDVIIDMSGIEELEDGECVVRVRGYEPFIVEKYTFEDHPNYKLTGDADETNSIFILDSNNQ